MLVYDEKWQRGRKRRNVNKEMNLERQMQLEMVKLMELWVEARIIDHRSVTISHGEVNKKVVAERRRFLFMGDGESGHQAAFLAGSLTCKKPSRSTTCVTRMSRKWRRGALGTIGVTLIRGKIHQLRNCATNLTRNYVPHSPRFEGVY
ncbi:uncharacterized protein CANTADRAFT_25646 [Suhomyces tanzawaensis NRRL Y-17324]|uniref:Uncharacterized protein n=1 Tax=Suhomyces tanzawaensis NRRL Y-17324 TaxID=984487 RepID=A0A1E4SJW3_9ASCO|nr:uncharacterized protein CANTADRAFT_25646 [Suhomyces tanzawaensis NRRL Y-17324]ODV79796.1 hypothetical protein CANTADRAFT_25646 [Suhomyces tanzawaensis NRRL Y-17324]